MLHLPCVCILFICFHQASAGSHIPLIDIGAWTTKLPAGTIDYEARKDVATLVKETCETIGFFAIRNHGVNESAIMTLWKTAARFFDLPSEEKLKLKTRNETEYPYGYEQSETLVVGKNTDQRLVELEKNGTPPPDLKETLSLGPDNPLSGMPARKYPEEPAELREAMITYYQEMEVLARTLLRIFASALELREEWFDDKMDRHMSALRLLNYFEVDAKNYDHPHQLRAGAHTDYGALTILRGGGPGLQVHANDVWIDVPIIPDSFVINLGDLFQRWTNDRWVSTLHRVILPPFDGQKHRRQSIAYFVNVNGDTKVEALETCINQNQPPKYQKITAKEHLMLKHLSSMRATILNSASTSDEL